MPDVEGESRERKPKVSRLTETYFRRKFPAFTDVAKGIEKNGGGPLAKTVENRIREQEDRYEDVYRRHAKKHRSGATLGLTHISVEEYKRRLQKKVEQIVAESHFFQRITVNALTDLVGGSGRLKSQVESGTRGAGVQHGAGIRRSVDERLFGYPMEGDARGRPVCGYISRDENSLIHGTDMSGYGPVIIKYKRSRIINKTTVTSVIRITEQG